MEFIIKVFWFILVFVVYGMLVVVLFVFRLMECLYGIEVFGDLGILLVYWGGLFFVVFVVVLFVVFDFGVCKVVSVVVGISMISYLVVYGLMGFLDGFLCLVVFVDVLGFILFVVVIY